MAETASVCQVLPPLVAFGQDFPTAGPDIENAALRGWLHTALCLWRIAQLNDAERYSGFGATAGMLAAIADVGSAETAGNTLAPPTAAEHRFDVVGELLTEAAASPHTTHEWSTDLAREIQEGAEYLERTGAFRLAYSLLAGLRGAISELSLSDAGRVLAQQGRIARQLGAMQTADDHYRMAQRLGRRVRDPDIHVRALLGRGVIAATRGNYPEARTLFARSLRIAGEFHLAEHEIAAHNALLMAAVAARDVDGALTHGWHLFLNSAGLPDRQAEVLVNLAEVALLAGYPESALVACTEALTLTTIDRVLLAGYGTAGSAASALGRRDVLDSIASNGLRVVERSNQQFDRAYTLLELAEAYAVLSVREEANRLLERAHEIAERGRFFEIMHRADALATRLARMRSIAERSETPPSELSSSTIARGPEAPEATSDLSPASRQVIRRLAELRS